MTTHAPQFVSPLAAAMLNPHPTPSRALSSDDTWFETVVTPAPTDTPQPRGAQSGHSRFISTDTGYLDPAENMASDDDTSVVEDEQDRRSVASDATVRCYTAPAQDDQAEPQWKRAGPIVVRTNHPYDPSGVSEGARPVLYGIVHPSLFGTCELIHWPERVEPRLGDGLPLAPSATTLLVKQVKFELTEGQVRWLLHRLAGVVVQRVTRHPAGFVVDAGSAEGTAALQRPFTRGVLFDQHGVWVARTEAQHKAMISYMHQWQFRQRAQRLPRELLRISAFQPAPRSDAAPPAYRFAARGKRIR